MSSCQGHCILFQDKRKYTGELCYNRDEMDYIIYTVSGSRSDSQDNALERTAVFLSFVTTVLSFGVLAFSSFRPVHQIGLTVFIGLTVAYLASVLYGVLRDEA